MKKILFALAILPLLFMACSNDDDNLSITDFDHTIEMLYGEWRVTGVEAGGVTIDLTQAKNELFVAPTYLKFGADGTLTSEGILGEGTGTYGTKGKTIYTSIGNDKRNFEMTSLQATTAKIKLDAKVLGIPIINENLGMVTVTLTKDYERVVDFDYNITLLYGEWRATSLEGLPDGSVDLTHPAVVATYLTFDKNGVYASNGGLGNGTGRYATKEKTIFTLVDETSFDFEMSALEATTARIELNPLDIDFGIEIPKELELVTVVLTKQ